MSASLFRLISIQYFLCQEDFCFHQISFHQFPGCIISKQLDPTNGEYLRSLGVKISKDAQKKRKGAETKYPIGP